MNVVIFELGDERYALRAEQVLEVVNMLPATPVPFAPRALTGLINRAGEIMPRIHLGRALGRDGVLGGDDGVLIVARVRGAPHAFQISRVVTMIPAREEGMHWFNAAQPAPESTLIKGMFAWNDGMVWMLDADDLGLEAAPPAAIDARPPCPMGREESRRQAGPGRGEATPYLVMKVAGEFQALPLDQVESVLNITAITDLPQAPREVSGMVCLRGAPCLAISLALLLGRGGGDEPVMVVVTRGGARIGLLIQEVAGISRFVAADRQETAEGANTYDGYFLNEDRCMIALIRLDALLPEARLARYRGYLGRPAEGCAAA